MMSSNLVFQSIRNVRSQMFLTVNRDNWADPYIRQQARLNDFPYACTQHWLQRRHPDNSAKFINRATGLVIDATGGNLVDHTLLQQYVDTGNANQRWTGDDLDGSTYLYALNTIEVWDVPNGSMNAGEIVQLSRLTGDVNQQWIFAPVLVEPTFKLVCRESQLVLDVPSFSPHDGVVIQQSADNGGFNQIWQVTDEGFGLSKIISVCNGKLLDAPLGSENRPAHIGQYLDNGGRNQLWNLQDLGNGFTKIVPALSVGFALGVPPGSDASGVPVGQSQDNGGANQQWQLVPVGP